MNFAFLINYTALRNYHFLPLLLIVFLFGCNQPTKDRYKISPPPSDNEASFFEASVKALSDAIRSNPSVSENYFKRATIFFQNRQFKESLKDINRAAELSPNNADYLLLKAKLLKENGEIDKAWQLINQVESYNLESVDYYLIMAELSVYKKDTLAAKANLASAQKLSPYSGNAFFVKGILLEQIQNDTVQAMDFYQKALTYNKAQPIVYDKIINFLQRRSLPDSAISIVDKAIMVFPEEVKWKNTKAEILRKNTLYERAIQVYESVYEQDTTQADALVKMADIRIGQKAYSSAIRYLKKAIPLEAKPAKLLYLTAFCNEKLQNYSEAQLFYIKAAKADPEMRQAVEGQNRTTRIVNQAIGLTY
ncbi:MAG: tetratricopeptide repeat protein [Spirosomaceae bacterium]|nr:tetratricopeptide repeat protein [Spirosomataceae bacterium]